MNCGRPQTLARNEVEAGETGFSNHGQLRSGHQRATGPGQGVRTNCRRCSTFARRAHGAALRREPASAGRAVRLGQDGNRGAEQLHGKELSFNNLVDLDACWQLVCEFSGAGGGDYQAHESRRMRRTDVACGGVPEGARMRSGFGVRRRDRSQPRSRRRDRREMAKIFVEAIAAPSYSEERWRF